MKDVRDKFDRHMYCDEFVSLMKKFEVIHVLDEKRILIPSFLPVSEKESCRVHSNMTSSNEHSLSLQLEPHREDKSISNCGFQVFCRYFLLPFIPNGFFGRLIARLMTSDILDQLCTSLASDPLESISPSYKMHWKCWRQGIIIIWNKKEIFRVAPLTDTLPSSTEIVLVSEKDKEQLINMPKGLEIKIAVVPEHKVLKCRFLEPALMRLKEQIGGKKNDASMSQVENKSKGKCIASWLLHRVSAIITSIFNDWYEGFASRRQEKNEILKVANYCGDCLSLVSEPDSDQTEDTVNQVFVYTSEFCCLAACKGEDLQCPIHGNLKIEDVAPDLVSLDGQIMFCTCMVR